MERCANIGTHTKSLQVHKQFRGRFQPRAALDDLILPIDDQQIFWFQGHLVKTTGWDQKMIFIQANGDIPITGANQPLAGNNVHHPNNFAPCFLLIVEFHRVYFATSVFNFI